MAVSSLARWREERVVCERWSYRKCKKGIAFRLLKGGRGWAESEGVTWSVSVDIAASGYSRGTDE